MEAVCAVFGLCLTNYWSCFSVTLHQSVILGYRNIKLHLKQNIILCLPPFFLVVFQIMPVKGDILSTSVHILKELLRVGPFKK